MQKRLAAALFDMDGLMIYSEPLWRKAQLTLFGEMGLPITHDELNEINGMRIDEQIHHWHQKYPWDTPSIDVVAKALRSAIINEIEALDHLLPGVDDALTTFREAGMRIALASSSPQEMIDTVVNKFNLNQHFDVCRSAEDELFGKPDPGVFLTAASILKVEPECCVVLEDSVNGVVAAARANMKCIAVPSASEDLSRFESADLVLSSLTQLTEIDWQSALT